jgi:hypothetical protein
MEWTFDPLEIKNSFLNLPSWERLFAATLCPIFMVYPLLDCTDRFLPTGSTRNGGWIAIGFAPPWAANRSLFPRWSRKSQYRIKLLIGGTLLDQERVLDIQTRNREHFQQAFARRLAVVGFRIDAEGNGSFNSGDGRSPFRLLTITTTGIWQVS